MTRSAPGSGALFVVATPIGNLADLSPRAASVLRDAGVVAAEDTRRTRALLAHLGIPKKEIVRLDENASEQDVERLAERVASGVDVAFVTDAGTPGVSDPGTAIVRGVRARGARIVPVPGPSAALAALSVAGFAGAGFRFAGFLPRGGPRRREEVARASADEGIVVLFEAPSRTAATLAELAGATPARPALVARELTKVHEELLHGPLERLALLARDREWLGEVTIVLGPHAAARAAVAPSDLDGRIDELIAAGRRPRDVAALLALESGLPKRAVYERVLARKDR